MYECPYLSDSDAEAEIMFSEGISESSAHISMCWCNKVGGKVSSYGQCGDSCIGEDICTNNSRKYHSQKSPRTKRERDLRYKRKAIQKAKLYHGVYYRDEKFICGKGFVPVAKPYYKRFYRSKHKNSRSSYYKSYSNGVVRRYKGDISNGGAYRKLFDYWWEVD